MDTTTTNLDEGTVIAHGKFGLTLQREIDTEEDFIVIDFDVTLACSQADDYFGNVKGFEMLLPMPTGVAYRLYVPADAQERWQFTADDWIEHFFDHFRSLPDDIPVTVVYLTADGTQIPAGQWRGDLAAATAICPECEQPTTDLESLNINGRCPACQIRWKNGDLPWQQIASGCYVRPCDKCGRQVPVEQGHAENGMVFHYSC